MAAEQDDVHGALSDLLRPTGSLAVPPRELAVYFDDLAIARLAKAYMALQRDISSGGHAVVVTAGPPGAGKTEALATLALPGYRRIDPDVAKDLILREAEHHGLLFYRHSFVLPDGKPVGVHELASHVHSISTKTTDIVRQLALSAGENVVIDGTLSWEPLADQYLSELFSAGYEELEVVDVEAPLATAIARARTRWWDGRQKDPQMGGRFVPDDVIARIFTGTAGVSNCAANAWALAERAADELGKGVLRRFDVDPATGVVRLTQATAFSS